MTPPSTTELPRIIEAHRRYELLVKQIQEEYDRDPVRFFPFWRRPPFRGPKQLEIVVYRSVRISAEAHRRLRKELRERGVPV